MSELSVPQEARAFHATLTVRSVVRRRLTLHRLTHCLFSGIVYRWLTFCEASTPALIPYG